MKLPPIIEKLSPSEITKNALSKHIVMHQWDDAMLLLANDGISQAREIDCFDAYPLHLAICCEAPDNLLLALINAHVEAVRKQNSYLCLPLHLATRWGVSSLIMEVLLGCYPEGLDVKNKVGKTPRDLMCATLDSKTREMVVDIPRWYWEMERDGQLIGKGVKAHDESAGYNALSSTSSPIMQSNVMLSRILSMFHRTAFFEIQGLEATRLVSFPEDERTCGDQSEVVYDFDGDNFLPAPLSSTSDTFRRKSSFFSRIFGRAVEIEKEAVFTISDTDSLICGR